MKFVYQMKIVLITILGVLCAILLVNLLRKLRSALPWRVNCWFCNHNSWVKLPERNSWTCSKCEQYNGFNTDGDYNKPLFTANEPAAKSLSLLHRSPPKSPPKNGLCKMCNINQQLKVAQLANFVPMNERRFNEEIESFKVQLEKAYKLCSPCKKVLQTKLHKEKETLLGSKLLDSRTPEKKYLNKKENQNELVKNLLNRVSVVTATLLFILAAFECCKIIMTDDKLPRTIIDMKELVRSLIERVYSIVEMKALMTFPYLDSYFENASQYVNIIDFKHKILTNHSINYDHILDVTQQALGGLACLTQILGHIFNVQLKRTYAIDVLLTVFVVTCLSGHSVDATPILLSVIKVTCVSAILMIHNISVKTMGNTKVQTPPKKLKNLARSVNSMMDDEDSSTLDTDDDVSLHKFGLHNFTDSSNENMSQLNSTINSGRAFTPRSHDGIWSKPKLNSTFCVNSLMVKSPSSVSDTVFLKPSFDKYQKLSREDSDSELDDSISSLCIGSPQKAKRKSNSIFSLRKFTATPSFVAPTKTSMNHTRPLISPSKLGHSTSWVAGGYWGSESERQIFNINGSRSSSQSSGFESQASSLNQKNVFSQPPSREASDCGEPERANMLHDRFQNCNMSSYNYYQVPQNFSRVASPIYPQMQYNGHVHIPQPRFAQQSEPSIYGFRQQPQSLQNNMFKTPGGSGIIKLPQVGTFSTR